MNRAFVSRNWPLLALAVSVPLAGSLQQTLIADETSDLTENYLLLTTSKTSTMQKELNEAAVSGFRVLRGCRTGGGELALLLEKAQSPEKYEYKLLATQLTSTMQKELDEAAAQGFRLLPRTMMGGESEIVVVLEKAPGQTILSRYLLLATKSTGTLQKEIEQAAQKGFHVVGIASRKEHLVILEKRGQPPGEGTATAPVRSKTDLPNQYLLLTTEKTSTMQKELDKAAKAGYRILAGSPTGETEGMMLLEKAAEPPLTFQYRLLATNKTSTMQKELNDASASDFCLRWESVSAKRGTGGGWRSLGSNVGIGSMGSLGIVAAPDEIVSVLEKVPNPSKRCQYLVIGTMKTATMQREIYKAALEGYQLAAMVGNPSKPDGAQLMGVMANLVVVLEKELRQ